MSKARAMLIAESSGSCCGGAVVVCNVLDLTCYFFFFNDPATTEIYTE